MTKKLQELLNKDIWTEEDKEWLHHYLQNNKGSQLHDVLLEQFNKNSNEIEGGENVDAPAMLNNLHSKIGVVKNINRNKPFRIWAIMIAAACVTAFLLFSIYSPVSNNYKIVKQHPGTAVAPIAYKNDVAPGGSNAVLTLGDGSSIVLDDAGDGKLCDQGNTSVIKINGKLAYNMQDADGAEFFYNTITTPRGGQYQITLEDGSEIWLNSASSLRFPTAFTGAERVVEITGECYFEIAKRSNMPFIVKTNNSEIKVLGTHFNVMAYPDEAAAKTTLLEGSIQFTHKSVSALLKPGQQAQVSEGGGLKLINDINTENVMGWKNGRFHFVGQEIESVMKQLARWYDVDVVYKNMSRGDLFYAEIPKNTNISEVLKALELTGKVKFEVDGKKIVVIQ